LKRRHWIKRKDKIIQRYRIRNENFRRNYRRAKPHRVVIKGKTRRIYEKKPPKPPPPPPDFLYRISVAINDPIWKDDRGKLHPTVTSGTDSPRVGGKYYGFLYQAWSEDADNLDLREAESELISLVEDWLGYKKVFGEDKWEWFSFTVGKEGPTEVPYEKKLVDRWKFFVETEGGKIEYEDGGDLG